MLAPTLIVGLGGTGADIIQRVENMVTEEQKQNLSFVLFDTDINEINQRKIQGFEGEAIQTSKKMSVGEYLNIDTHARDNWFPVNRILNRKTLTEGAGQVRAISRLALDTTIRSGNMEPLHKAIDKLYKLSGDSMDQSLRVMIVSSLAGGTGSGLILPVSMYLKNYITTMYQQSASIIRGFFLLPEVFYNVIPGQVERNNLKCNAYATVRELDAFLMKGDGSLDSKYKDLKFEIPRAGSQICDDIDVMPFDFCFLFDAQNMDGKKLGSFEAYKDHAASCIYAQSISPMNTRSNSSEDNVIRDLCKSGGRNRYCGAGSAILKYPVEDIKEYVALSWAKDCISKEWLGADEAYRKRNSENQKMKNSGQQVKDIDRGEEYINYINAKESQKDYFAMQIVGDCYEKDDAGFIEKDASQWNAYIEKIKEHIANNLDDNLPDVKRMEGSLRRFQSDARESDDSNTLNGYYRTMIKFKNLVNKKIEPFVQSISFTLFKADKDKVSENNDVNLEYYLSKDGEGLVHPNTARYFLYNLIKQLDEEIEDTRMKTENLKKAWTRIDEKADFIRFLNDGEGDKIKTVDQYLSENTKGKKIAQDAKDKLCKAFDTYFDSTVEYKKNYAVTHVLTAARAYAQNLARSFELLYTNLDANIAKINEDISIIKDKFNNNSGTAIRYVCASKNCIDKIGKKAVFQGGGQLPPKLCKDLFLSVKKYAMLEEDERPTDGKYFINSFNEIILNHWKKKVIEEYGFVVDMDIITAMQAEVKYENNIVDNEVNSNYILNKVRNIIGEAKKLASPFIETPMGEEKRIIHSCTYNENLIDANAPDSIKNLVNSELKDCGGVKAKEEECDKYQIIFFDAVYGLRANDLSKFAPPIHELTVDRSAGEYYKAYFELIQMIKPDTLAADVITPHIDRHWHLITKLPDLDEGNQIKLEKNILKALYLGFVMGNIEYVPKSEGSQKMQYIISGGDNNHKLVVNNGTDVDEFYEVLEALENNLVAANKVLDDCKKEFEDELSNKVSLDKSNLMEKISKLRFPELSEGKNKLRSIFELPILYKHTAPIPEYNVSMAKLFVDTIIEVTRDYIASYVNPVDVDDKLVEILKGQFNLFEANIYEPGSVYSKSGNIANAPITTYIYSTLKVLAKSVRDKEFADRLSARPGQNAAAS